MGRGSSPLTRGKLHARDERPRHPGLIPAHAGKTSSAQAHMRTRKAHPRSRGENEALAASDATDKGSSPLTRGKLISISHHLGVRGLIPAHAGKT